jgi:membrane-associated protein
MLFAAGGLAALGAIDLWVLNASLITAAVLGNMVNYLVGRYVGDWVFKKKWISKDSFDKAHSFYEKFGGFALVAARFLPIFRTYVPFIAGTVRMRWHAFILWNLLGAFLWSVSLSLLGYFFANIPFIKNNLNIIVLIGIAAAAGPVLIVAVVKVWKKWFEK